VCYLFGRLLVSFESETRTKTYVCKRIMDIFVNYINPTILSFHDKIPILNTDIERLDRTFSTMFKFLLLYDLQFTDKPRINFVHGVSQLAHSLGF